MEIGRKKRALVLIGAGASLDLGAPSTADLTNLVENKVCSNKILKSFRGDSAYMEIKEKLLGYLQGGADSVNFEHIYHCAHELLFTFDPYPNAVNEYRPVLVPFINRRFEADENALRNLVQYMAKFIFNELSAACEKTTESSLKLLAEFLANLRKNYITRIYTTNYDDFLLQAANDLYTGFPPDQSSNAKSFDNQAFWKAINSDSVFHLHGSVHLGFGPSQATDLDLNSLHWFDDRKSASPFSTYTGSQDLRMDGSQSTRTAVISGLNKLSNLQQQPFSHYYTSMALDAMKSDIVILIGYGLRDFHINTWLSEARHKKPMPSLVFVDKYPNCFIDDTAFEYEFKTKQMAHALRMPINDIFDGDEYRSGWTLAKDSTCAVWDKGFLALLELPNEIDYILAKLV